MPLWLEAGPTVKPFATECHKCGAEAEAAGSGTKYHYTPWKGRTRPPQKWERCLEVDVTPDRARRIGLQPGVRKLWGQNPGVS